MWTDDLEIVESCGFHRSLLIFDSNNSIGEYAATDTFANMKTPNPSTLVPEEFLEFHPIYEL